MKKFLYTREGVCILVRIDPICIVTDEVFLHSTITSTFSAAKDSV